VREGPRAQIRPGPPVARRRIHTHPSCRSARLPRRPEPIHSLPCPMPPALPPALPPAARALPLTAAALPLTAAPALQRPHAVLARPPRPAPPRPAPPQPGRRLGVRLPRPCRSASAAGSERRHTAQARSRRRGRCPAASRARALPTPDARAQRARRTLGAVAPAPRLHWSLCYTWVGRLVAEGWGLGRPGPGPCVPLQPLSRAVWAGRFSCHGPVRHLLRFDSRPRPSGTGAAARSGRVAGRAPADGVGGGPGLPHGRASPVCTVGEPPCGVQLQRSARVARARLRSACAVRRGAWIRVGRGAEGR
jgi:hypothetical protein